MDEYSENADADKRVFRWLFTIFFLFISFIEKMFKIERMTIEGYGIPF